MAWRFGGGIFTKTFSHTQLLLFTFQRHTEMYLHLERIDCAFNRWDYIRISASTFGHPASRADSHGGEVFSLLAGRTSHRSLATSRLLHLYHTLAWRTCCLLKLWTSHDVFDFTPLSLQDTGNDL